MIPDWLLEEVKAERLVLGLASILRPELEGAASDAEVCVYLYTASLRAPMAPEYVQVYLHLVAKLMKRLARALRRRWEREKTAAAGGGQLVVASS